MKFRSMLSTAAAAILFAAAAVIVLAAGLPDRAESTGTIQADGSVIAPETGAIAPPFEGITLEGGTLDLASLNESPVILNFWATWCGPCAVEMPELQAFHNAHPTVPLIGINTGESREIVQAWIASGGYTFTILLDPDYQISRRYALRGQPTTIILAPGGMISQIIFGATTRAALEGVLAPYLG